MTVRIYFNVADLARTHIAERPDPLWEAVLSMHVLQRHEGAPAFTRWRRRTLPRLDGSARALLTLAPPRGYRPDFLTPTGSALGLEQGLRSLAATSPDRFRTDLGLFARLHRIPLWVRDLRPRNLPRIADAMREYYSVAVRPYESQLRSHVQADSSLRTLALQGSGIDVLLNSLCPQVRWQYPLLEVHSESPDRDIRLDGRGLRLIPSFFCSHGPMMLRDPQLPPVLVYPVKPRPGWEYSTHGSGRAHTGVKSPCAALVGNTRAAALEVIADGCTTSELARRLEVSPAAASHHTAILREAGLISSHRSGGSVQHTLKPLGKALLCC